LLNNVTDKRRHKSCGLTNLLLLCRLPAVRQGQACSGIDVCTSQPAEFSGMSFAPVADTSPIRQIARVVVMQTVKLNPADNVAIAKTNIGQGAVNQELDGLESCGSFLLQVPELKN
jgi:hypothetical protein